MRLSYEKPEDNQLEAMLLHIDLLTDLIPVIALGKFPGCRDHRKIIGHCRVVLK